MTIEELNSRPDLYNSVLVREPRTVVNEKTGEKEEETYINLSRNIPVYITYRTVFFDEFGQIHYRADVYGRDALVYMALVEAGVSIY